MPKERRDFTPLIGLAAAALALIGAPLFNYVTKPAAPLTRNAPEDYERVVRDVDDFWRANFAEQFPGALWPYTSPKVWFRDRIIMDGRDDGGIAGLYDPNTQAIIIRNSGSYALVAHVIAHEFAHHVQYLSGGEANLRRRQTLSWRSTSVELGKLYELQAECLAGVWAKDAAARGGVLEERDVKARLGRAMFLIDSPTPGTAAERIEAFSRGYRSGRAADCPLD